MALADPQVLSVDGASTNLPRISDEANKSVYRTADENQQGYTLTISHSKQNNNSIRTMVRIDRNIIAENPLTTSNAYRSSAVYLVIQRPDFGFTDLQVKALCTTLSSWLAASGNTEAILQLQH